MNKPTSHKTNRVPLKLLGKSPKMSDRKNTKNFPESIPVDRYTKIWCLRRKRKDMKWGAPDFCREAQFKNYQSCSLGEPGVWMRFFFPVPSTSTSGFTFLLSTWKSANLLMLALQGAQTDTSDCGGSVCSRIINQWIKQISNDSFYFVSLCGFQMQHPGQRDLQ